MRCTLTENRLCDRKFVAIILWDIALRYAYLANIGGGIMGSFWDVFNEGLGWLAFVAFVAVSVWAFRLEGRIRRLESGSDKRSKDKPQGKEV